jgi:hypothetical protein
MPVFIPSPLYRHEKSDLVHKDLQASKIACIYVYYHRQNEQKNETNLMFFIKYGMQSQHWLPLDIDYVFVLNNGACEVNIPSRENVFVIQRESGDGGSDYEGWFDGVHFLQNHYQQPIWQIFDYLCLLNVSAMGPFIAPDLSTHWLFPFHAKMVEDSAVVCSPCGEVHTVESLRHHISVGEGLKLGLCFHLLKITKDIYNLLFQQRHQMCCFTNSVYGPKATKYDCIITGEYALPMALSHFDYKITCLYVDKETPNRRVHFYQRDNEPLKDTVFIKNVWRTTESSYMSAPILYEYCVQFMKRVLDITNPFEEDNVEYDYENVEKKNVAIDTIAHVFTDFEYTSKFYTKSGRDSNMVYGYAEEWLLWPTQQKKNNACVIYAHHDVDNLMREHVISSLKILLVAGYDVYLYTTCPQIKNYTFFPFPVTYVDGKVMDCRRKIWEVGLKDFQRNPKYEWIMLLHSDVVVGIHGIKNFKNTILQQRQSCNAWKHWDDDLSPVEFRSQLVQNILLQNQVVDYKIISSVPNEANVNNLLQQSFIFAFPWRISLSTIPFPMRPGVLNYLLRYL